MPINATLLNDLQIKAGTTDETRTFENGAVNLARHSTDSVEFLTSDAIDKLTTATSDRLVKFPAIEDGSVTVTTSPGFIIPSNQETTAAFSFTAVDIFSGFHHTDSLYESNQVASEEAQRAKMKKVLYNMAIAKEDAILAVLEARKTQVLDFTLSNAVAGVYSFNTGTDTLEISLAAQKEGLFTSLQGIATSNKIGGVYQILSSTGGLQRPIHEMLKYGDGNQFNLQNPMMATMPMENIHYSMQVLAGSDIMNGYYVRMGAIGMVENFPFDFRNATKLANQEWMISDVELPYIRSRANIFVERSAVDATGILNNSNTIMTTTEKMGIWDRFYIVYNYNSDLTTRANDIVKIKGLTS